MLNMGQGETRSRDQTKREAGKYGAYVRLKTTSSRKVSEREQ